MATRDKSRKSKKGKAGRRRVVVVRRRRKRPAKRVKRKAGTGVFGSHFPTNRTIDSNQYWQLRAEIAGAESRVGTRLKDRQAEYDRKEANIDKIKKQVDKVMTPEIIAAAVRNSAMDGANAGAAPPPTPAVVIHTGQAHVHGTSDDPGAAAAGRRGSSGSPASTYHDTSMSTPSSARERTPRRREV